MDSNNVHQVIFTCFLCNKRMHDKSGYREHMKICIFLDDDGVRLFPCFLCGEELQNKTGYREHLKMCLFNSDCSRKNMCKETISDPVPLPCCSCGKKFKNAVEFDTHAEIGVCTVDHRIKIESKCEENRETADEVCETVVNLTSTNNPNMSESMETASVRQATSNNARVNFEVIMETHQKNSAISSRLFDSAEISKFQRTDVR